MHAKMLTEAAYPPPPPSPTTKSSRKMLIIAVVIVIIVVAVVVGVYFITAKPGSSANPTPTPSTTPTPTGGTPTATPTASPSDTTPAANFRAGAWAQYAIKAYGETGELTSENTMKYAIEDGTYNGVACWLLKVEMDMSEDATKMVMTYWMNKNTLEGIHVKTQMYTNGELTYEHEGDISPDEGGDMPEPIDLSTSTGHETITVPAGTFDCSKVTVTSTVSGTTSTTSQWVSSNVPIIGLVKIETTSGGVVTSKTELTAYGG